MAQMIGNAANTLLIETRYGTISINLLPQVAPETVAQIKAIARAGDYDNVAFHRVIAGFMAQTGDVEYGDLADGWEPRLIGTGGSDRPDIPLEPSDISFERGVVGMARSADPDSGNSQFFITTADARYLDWQYTVFGRVFDGMGAVDRIKRGNPLDNGLVEGTPDRMLQVIVADDLAPGNVSIGRNRADTVVGGDAAEYYLMYGGDDLVRAGGGQDTILGGTRKDTLRGGAGKDTLRGEAGADTLDGGSGHDRIEGGTGRDLLVGGAGADTLFGGADADTLDGGAGDDVLTGGRGADLFKFSTPDFGRDRIEGGFALGADRIDLTGSGYGPGEITIRQGGGNTTLTFEGGSDRIVIVGVTGLVGQEAEFLLF